MTPEIIREIDRKETEVKVTTAISTTMETQARPALATQEVFDSIIRVDRSIRPSYPSWVKVVNPELEATGPAEFDIQEVEQWYYPGQLNKRINGALIYGHLVRMGILASCLGLRDLEEIEKKGTDFFRQHWKGKCVFGWKSVVVNNNGGGWIVPYLMEDHGKVRLIFFGFADFGADSPALCFRK